MQMPTFTWTVSMPASVTTLPAAQVLNPFKFLITDATCTSIQDVTQWYFYIRSDLEIHFRLNTNQFYAGALAISARPGGVGNFSDSLQQARSWLGMKIISAAKQDTVVLTLPWPLPERFVPISDIINNRGVWTVYIDILSPLVAAISSPSGIDVSIFVRFKNPQLVFPWHAQSPHRNQSGKQVVKQSGSSTQIKLPRYKAKRQVVHVSTSHKDPVQEAQSPSSPSVMSTVGTLLGMIPTVGPILEEATTLINPVMSIVSALGGLLDKPEMDEPPMRVYPNVAANMCTVDSPDQSQPLATYKTSYLNIDPSVIPGGENWTVARVAQTPVLHSQFTFTSTSNECTVPFLANGTPFSLAANSHAFWRGSVRYMIKFFASAFISGRLLLVLSPSATASENSIANNLSRVIDVKGDTTDCFTVPFVYPYDFYPGILQNPVPPASMLNLQFSLLNQIVTNDVSVTPSIDMVIFAAAGPDCQFSGPLDGYEMEYTYPNTSAVLRVYRAKLAAARKARERKKDDMFDFKIVKQCDVFAEFKIAFPPFMQDCQYLADSHHVVSETTMYVTDLMKRYQAAGPPLNSVTSTVQYPSTYNPASVTLGYLWSRCFMFKRGGVRYKLIFDPTSPRITAAWACRQVPWAGIPVGRATQMSSSFGNSSVLDITVPHMVPLPFYSEPNLQNMVGDGIPVFALSSGTDAAPQIQNFLTLTAVRDDFQLGFLIAPDVVAS